MGCARQRLTASRVLDSGRRCTVPVLLALLLGGCRTSPAVPRYIATVAPIKMLSASHPGICIAIDPADPQSAWWWEPGPSGCSSRTTGPTVFRVPATVGRPGGPGDLEVHFQLPLMAGMRDVSLLVTDGGMRETSSGAPVST